MGLIRLTAPAVEPITVLEAQKHIRLDDIMMEPTPDAPTVALANPVAPGNVDNGQHRYRVTFVTADGETDGGDISAPVTVVDKTINGQVAVAGIQTGGSFVTGRKLYRTKADADTFFLVATLADNTTTTFTDNVADASLGAGVPTRNSTSDPLVKEMIVTAREYCETYTRRAFIQQQWRYTLDCFPGSIANYGLFLETLGGLRRADLVDVHSDSIRLPKPPLVSVESVKYIDVDGNLTTLDPTLYKVTSTDVRGEVFRAYGQVWPYTRNEADAVLVDFTCGYGTLAANVPSQVRQAMRVLVEHYYNNRGVFVENRFALAIPHSVDDLLWQVRAEEAA